MRGGVRCAGRVRRVQRVRGVGPRRRRRLGARVRSWAVRSESLEHGAGSNEQGWLTQARGGAVSRAGGGA